MTVGAAEYLADQTASSTHYMFHTIPQDRYLELFNKYRLGDCPLALELQVDGNETILRQKLGDMLEDLLDRRPRKHELQAWFTFCDYDRGCTLGLEEYLNSIQALREFSQAPDPARHSTSYEHITMDKFKHKRSSTSPQKSLQGPITTNMEVGWGAHKVNTPNPEYHPLMKTDVTLKEGRSLVAYYGHLTLL